MTSGSCVTRTGNVSSSAAKNDPASVVLKTPVTGKSFNRGVGKHGRAMRR